VAQAWIQPDRPRLTASGLFMVAAVLLFPLVAAFVAAAAPRLAALQHRTAVVLAANHLLTLGWGTLIALGALHQLLPAAAGVRHEPGRAVAVQLVVHLAGVALLAAGFFWERRPVLIAGGAAVVLSVLASAATAAWVLRRRRRWDEPLWFVTAALACLVLVVLWGLTLGVNLRYAFWPALLRPMGLIVHLSLGLVGWFGLLVTGVSYYLLPRFTTRRSLEGSQPRLVLGLLIAAVAALLAGAFAAPPLVRAGLALAAAAGGVYAADVRRFVAAWNRARDITRLHWQLLLAETVLLSAGALAYAAGALPGPSARWAVAGVTLFLTGWMTGAITGQAYKVTPFLMWYYRFALGMPAYDVPRLEAPYWPRGALPAAVLTMAGGPLISLGVLLSAPGLAAVGGWAYFAGACGFSYLLGYSWLPRLWKVSALPAGTRSGPG
jgi:hypothetical protein